MDGIACLTRTEGHVCQVHCLLQSCPRLSAAARGLHAPSASGYGRARSVVAVSGLADEVLQSSAAQQWTSQLYPRPPGE